jgi:hypothetical protein
LFTKYIVRAKNVCCGSDKAGFVLVFGDYCRGTTLAALPGTVNIRFTSSLTDHDENLIAPALLNAVASVLDLLPIAYVIRIDTTDAKVYQHSRPVADIGTIAEHRDLHGTLNEAR